MDSRKWNVNKDYSTIFSWCKQYNWDTAIPKEVLPIVSDLTVQISTDSGTLTSFKPSNGNV